MARPPQSDAPAPSQDADPEKLADLERRLDELNALMAHDIADSEAILAMPEFLEALSETPTGGEAPSRPSVQSLARTLRTMLSEPEPAQRDRETKRSAAAEVRDAAIETRAAPPSTARAEFLAIAAVPAAALFLAGLTLLTPAPRLALGVFVASLAVGSVVLGWLSVRWGAKG